MLLKGPVAYSKISYDEAHACQVFRARLAQLVEHIHGKDGVSSSSLLAGSIA